MKKALLTICFAAFTLAAFAQLPSFGVKGGVNFASQQISEDGAHASSGTLTTFNVGVFADFKFGNLKRGSLSLQPALNYTGKGAKYTGDATNLIDGTDAGSVTVKEQLYYLQLPINLVYHIPVLIGNVYIGTGPYIAQGISGKVKAPAGVLTNEDGTPATSANVHFGNNEDDLKAQQYGIDFILGLQFKKGFLINANYDLGLSNDYPAVDGGVSGKSGVFGFSVGYKF